MRDVHSILTMVKQPKIKFYYTIRTRFFRFDFIRFHSYTRSRMDHSNGHNTRKKYLSFQLVCFLILFPPSLLGSTWYALCDRKVVLGNREGWLPQRTGGSDSSSERVRVLYDLRDRRSFTAVSSPHLPPGDYFKRLTILRCTSLPRKHRRPARVKNHITFTTILFVAVERFFCVVFFFKFIFLLISFRCVPRRVHGSSKA